MSKAIKKHWFGLSICLLMLPLILPILLPTGLRAQMSGKGPTPEALCSQVQQLRADYCLTDEDLAALGCSAEQTKLIIDALKQYVVGNFDQLHKAYLLRESTAVEVKKIHQMLAIGSTDTATLGRALTDARSRHLQAGRDCAKTISLVEACFSHLLTPAQAQANLLARVGRRHPGLYRYCPDIRSDQVAALTVAGPDGSLNLESQVLSDGQRVAVSRARQNLHALHTAVSAAAAARLANAATD